MPFLPTLKNSSSQLRLSNPSQFIFSVPLRYAASTCTSRPRFRYNRDARAQLFSSSSSYRLASNREPTYYEILDVPITATPAEIKKKFYSLSLRHHPDRNRKDPTASARFAKFSSAYHVLSNTAKRAAYDHDNNIHSAPSHSSTHSSAQAGQHPMGSYSSHSSHKGASYFGSRPASGLSKRRGPFRGPPPSFYAHGGYGGSGRNAPNPSASGAGAGAGAGAAGSSGSSPGSGAANHADDDPTSFIDRNPVSHFNARGHYRTQTAEDQRRRERRAREMGASINDQYLGKRGDFAMRFLLVCGILVGAGAISGLFRWPNNAAALGDRTGKTPKSTRGKDG